MLSNRHDPQHKEVEEAALFQLSRMISLKKAGITAGHESYAIQKLVLPLLEKSRVHDSIHENRIAFALLGSLLNPTNGQWRFLPQHAPHWLAFRRLFLKVCNLPIPQRILDLGIWAEDHEITHRAQVDILGERWMIGEDWMETLRSFLKTIDQLLKKRDRIQTDLKRRPGLEATQGRRSSSPEEPWTAFLLLLVKVCRRFASSEDRIENDTEESAEAMIPTEPLFSLVSEENSDADRKAVLALLNSEQQAHREDWAKLFGLYLEICASPVPRKVIEGDLWLDAKEALSGGLNALLVEEPILDGDTLNEREHPWEKDFLPQLKIIKQVTAERLSDYSKLTLSSVKEHFMEHGKASLEAECGALYDVVQEIDWDAVPESEEIDETVDSTQLWLKRIMTERKPEFNFDDEYARAVRSVRGVLFDLAIEKVLGKSEPGDLSAWECEKRAFENQLLRDPYSTLSDDRILFYMVDGIGQQGRAFAQHLADRLETLEAPMASESQQAVFTLKRTMALHWLHPDLPLWLMHAIVVQSVVRPLLPKNHRCTVDQIKEVTKNRSNTIRTGLHNASKPPIVAKRVGKAEFGVEPIWIWNYAQKSRFGKELLRHLESAVSFPSSEAEPK